MQRFRLTPAVFGATTYGYGEDGKPFLTKEAKLLLAAAGPAGDAAAEASETRVAPT
jgi:hypothetical protein